MKVLGKGKDGSFICEVNQEELEKFFNQYLYYNGEKVKMEIGKEIDLGKGFDFSGDVKNALNKTRDFFKSNSKTIKAITDAFLVDAKKK